MLENAQTAPESLSSRSRDNTVLQANTWSQVDRVSDVTAHQSQGDKYAVANLLPPAADVFANHQMVNFDASKQLLKDNGRLFDALDSATGGHDGKISQNDLQVFLGDLQNSKHFSRHQLDAAKYLLDNWDDDTVKGLKTENSLFMNGYMTRETLAKGLGFDSRESLQAALDGRRSQATQTVPEALPPARVQDVLQRGETIYDVAKRSLVERSRLTGEWVNNDAIFHECNRIMVNSGFPDAHLESKTHITQRDLPRAWNSVRTHQVLTLYTGEELA